MTRKKVMTRAQRSAWLDLLGHVIAMSFLLPAVIIATVRGEGLGLILCVAFECVLVPLMISSGERLHEEWKKGRRRGWE